MTADRGRRAWVAVLVVLSAGFALLAHAALIDGVAPTVGAALSLLPLAFFALWAARRSGRFALVLAILAASGVALWLGWERYERNFQHVFFLEHAGAQLLLGFAFGHTLFGAREPLVTRFARMIHGTLPPEVERYTRRVTAAWTAFFAVLFMLSCGLYLGGWLAAWSLLANILTPLLVAAMFGVEYAVRLRALPHWERVGILGGIRAFSRHFAAAQPQAPR